MACCKSTIGRLSKFAGLRHGDQALLVRTLLLVALIRLSLWILPFQFVRRSVARRARPRRRTGAGPVSPIEKVVAAIELTARYVPAATCLTQALAAEILLTRRGYAPELRIGVLRKEGKFKAHAWVECAGKVVIGEVQDLAEFAALPRV